MITLGRSVLFFCAIFLFANCSSKSAKAKLIIDKSSFINDNANNLPKKIQDIGNPENTIGGLLFLSPTSTTGQIIKHNYFIVSYSEKDEQAEWVAYKLTKTSFNDNIERTNDYRYDPFVKTESATPFDYKGSGYDMGHLAPARTMSYSYTSMSESFYLSNISPQVPAFNRGIWKRLEEKVRYWAMMNDSIFVVTGPILNNPIGKIGINNVSVPKAFYKTLVGYSNGKVKGIAFIMPNEKSDKSIYKYATSIDEVEKITGIDFYFKMERNAQVSIEANGDLKIWLSTK